MAERPSQQACEHLELAPRWDNAADLGKPGLITFYSCGKCGRTLTPTEAEAQRQKV